MSYIFEALQRAEAERSGGNLPKNPDSVADLLRGVEEEIARKQSKGELANGDSPAIVEPTIVEPTIAEPTIVEPTIAEPTIVESTSGASRRVGSAAGQHEVVLPDYPRQRSVAVPTGRDLAAGVALAADPLPIVASPVANRESAPEPPLPPAFRDGESFANSRVLSPVVPPESKLVCLSDQGGLAAEKFRVLGLKLRHLRERRKLKRIVITGTAPEEGKSVVAANLALNQSRSRVLKTLLIDGDLRRPTLASRFGFDRSLPGLSECLRGERDLSEVVYKLNGSGLFLLPSGRAPENPLDLMQSGRLPELLEQLGKFFDWIIIDTPPVIPVADTAFWMKLADGVLVVIREGVSEKKTVERALDSFDRATLLGVVVNSCSDSDHKDYYTRYSQGMARSVEVDAPFAAKE